MCQVEGLNTSKRCSNVAGLLIISAHFELGTAASRGSVSGTPLHVIVRPLTAPALQRSLSPTGSAVAIMLLPGATP